MIFSVLGFLLAVALSLVLTPLVRQLSLRKGILDRPEGRKIHATPIPRLGGLAIFMAVLLPSILLLPLGRETQGFLIGLGILFVLGLVDDIRGLDARTKLPIQILAAWFLVVFGGVTIPYLDVPGVGALLLPVWCSHLLGILCVVALVNATNLIDGLDGLAAGTAMIVFAFTAIIGFDTGNPQVVLLSLIFIGAALGFLWYNWHPASIFMGDTGSTVLGFGLSYACLSVVYNAPQAQVSTWVPLGLVALPIFDTLWAVSRRIRRGKSPFTPDKSHVHHRLMRSGIPHPKVVRALYGLTFLLCLQAALLAQTNGNAIAGLTIATLIVFYAFIRWLQLPTVHALRLRHHTASSRANSDAAALPPSADPTSQHNPA